MRTGSTRIAALALAFGSSLAAGLAAGAAVPSPRRLHIVIDPGHGGGDHGTSSFEAGRPILEKDLTLTLALQAATSLRRQGHRVTLTRTGDVEVPLGDRTALANRLRADAFVSIHLNSQEHAGPAADGIETYVLNAATDASSHRLAALENSLLSAESRADRREADVALIVRDLTLEANLPASTALACALQSSLSGGPRPASRGVRQALFHVLLGAEMPSALVEAGFLTSPRDRHRLLSERGQAEFARALSGGLRRFADLPRARLLAGCHRR